MGHWFYLEMFLLGGNIGKKYDYILCAQFFCLATPTFT